MWRLGVDHRNGTLGHLGYLLWIEGNIGKLVFPQDSGILSIKNPLNQSSAFLMGELFGFTVSPLEI
jgi:hypothetical protein